MIHDLKVMMRRIYHKNTVFGHFYKILSRGKARILSKIDDETYLKIKFKTSTGDDLNLKNPRTFNEKIQWLKLYYHAPLYTKLVDKYAVREYVEGKIGNQYLTDCYGVYLRFDDIDFNNLPDRFVIKCTHDCGSIVLCHSKSGLDYNKTRKKINTALSQNYYYQSREWPYKNVKPRIIVEEYLEDQNLKDLYDYKFFCFNGVPKALFVATGRQSGDMRIDFYDMNFNKLPFERGYPNSDKKLRKPANFDKMVELAQTLSAGIPFVRVDFYDIGERIVFGEMTFSPGGGMEVFKPKKWDYIWGSWISLPEKKVL